MAGGCSPVAIRQTPAAARRAAMVAIATRIPESPVHASLRNMSGRAYRGSSAAKRATVCSRPMERRRLGKVERQRLIGSLVSRRRLGTQEDLRRALADAGCVVTQATVSRDIAELQLEKTEDDLGRPRYALPNTRVRLPAREALAAVLAQFGRRAVAAGNIVVVASELGSAPAIARALDRVDHPRVVGTLAGDDTCLVITPSESDAEALAAELDALIG